MGAKESAKKPGSPLLKLAGKYSFIIVFVLIFLIYVISSSGLTWAGAMNIFRHSAVVGIIAIGMGLICLTGEIDLSVGSMLALDSGFSVIIFNMTGSIIATLVFAILFGALCGMVNGFFVGYIGMPAFIVTLATMLIYRSFSQYFCQRIDKALLGGGSSVYKMSRIGGYDAMYGFGNGRLATIPIVGILLILFTALFVYIVNNTKYGKKVYAVGSNTKGALMAGINVNLIKISVFTIAGILVGLSSFMWIAMNASADPATTGSSYEMYQHGGRQGQFPGHLLWRAVLHRYRQDHRGAQDGLPDQRRSQRHHPDPRHHDPVYWTEAQGKVRREGMTNKTQIPLEKRKDVDSGEKHAPGRRKT